MSAPTSFSLTPGKRVLFLTKDPELVRRQLRGELDLTMDRIRVEELLDNVNTDAMTPAWVCFDWDPAEIAKNAYAGLIVEGARLVPTEALRKGNFEVIVSGFRKGTGSSRETAVQAEKWSGIRMAVAASFAPIHGRNNINQGVLMGDHAMLARLQRGEAIPLAELTAGKDPITRLLIEQGGLFKFSAALKRGAVTLPALSTPRRPMTMAEKIIARHAVRDPGAKGEVFVQPGDALLIKVDAGYSHEFTTAQVHAFLAEEFGADYQVQNPAKFAVFEDHLIYADGVAAMAPYSAKIETLRRMQREFQRHTGVLDYSAKDGVSPGICHQVAREKFINPGEIVNATDSHTCMGGASNALAWGCGATEYAGLIHAGFTFVRVPESIRFELHGRLPAGVTAKDLILELLATYAREQKTLDRVMEFGGPGLASLSLDERATLTNMATECSAFTGITECDAATLDWIAARRPDADRATLAAGAVRPDPGAIYAGGVHRIDLAQIVPMVATPGDPDRGIPSDPTNGARVADLPPTPIQIAYGGSCTAGKDDDMEFYAAVCREAAAAGVRVATGVEFFLQFGSLDVQEAARRKGYLELFARVGVKIIHPGCGACIGCGPGVSTAGEQVTVSAINRNFKGRSGPGKLWLASPLTVAASAFAGHIVDFRPGMFRQPAAVR
ncbi:MAG: aconitate hydratase [Planctomycetes bacterium]|nr:aconitate hydratase [Planctomycetota bacterium]